LSTGVKKVIIIIITIIITVQLSRFSMVLVDGLPKFHVKLERAAFLFNG